MSAFKIRTGNRPRSLSPNRSALIHACALARCPLHARARALGRRPPRARARSLGIRPPYGLVRPPGHRTSLGHRFPLRYATLWILSAGEKAVAL
eukprot:IDg18616t1